MSRLHKLATSGALFVFYLVLPETTSAQTLAELYDITILVLYGAVGFFGAVAFLYFFGGWAIYFARRGQEYRQEGIYHMLHAVRILSCVLVAAIILYFLE